MKTKARDILEINSTSTKHAEQAIYKKKKPTRKKFEKHGTYTKVEKLQITKKEKRRRMNPTNQKKKFLILQLTGKKVTQKKYDTHIHTYIQTFIHTYIYIHKF